MSPPLPPQMQHIVDTARLVSDACGNKLTTIAKLLEVIDWLQQPTDKVCNKCGRLPQLHAENECPDCELVPAPTSIVGLTSALASIARTSWECEPEIGDRLREDVDAARRAVGAEHSATRLAHLRWQEWGARMRIKHLPPDALNGDLPTMAAIEDLLNRLVSSP